MDARFSDSLKHGLLLPPVGNRAAKPASEAENVFAAEVRRPGEMTGIVGAWRRLAAHALEPCVFYEPDFLLPALQHLPEGRNVAMICVWQGPTQTGTLRGLFPVTAARLIAVPRDMRLWHPPFSDGVAPLIDRAVVEPAIETLLTALTDRGAAGVVFPGIVEQGPFAAALRDAGAHLRRPLDRRALNRSHPGRRPTDPDVGKPNALQAMRQRLSTLGELRIERAQEPRPVRDAVEEFLALDAVARKGAALIQDAGTAAFVRTMTREMTRSRRCRVTVLRIDGQPAAAAIFLKSAGRLWLWRAAQDEALAELAPDALLALEAAQSRPSGTHVEIGEFSGLSGHPAVRRLRPEPAGRVDLRIPLAPRSSSADVIGGVSRFARSIRSAAQHAYAGLAQRLAHPT